MIGWDGIKRGRQKSLSLHHYTPGIRHLLRPIKQSPIIPAESLVFSWHLRVIETKSLSKKIVVFELATITGVHLLLSEETAKQSLNIRLNDEEILLHGYCSF